MKMKPEDVKDLRTIHQAVRELMVKSAQDDQAIACLEARLEDVETKQGYLARRPKIAIPRFPRILRQYGMVPPHEKGAAP